MACLIIDPQMGSVSPRSSLTASRVSTTRSSATVGSGALFSAGALSTGVLSAGALAGRAAAAAAAGGRRLRALLAHEIVVIDELVAVIEEQIGGRVLDPDPDDRLGVLAQLAHQRREIRIAADDDEGVDVALGVAQVEGIDDHADVGGVLARLAHVRNFDELERGLVQAALEVLVAIKVAVGLLDHDVALQQQTLENLLDVEARVLGSRARRGRCSRDREIRPSWRRWSG